MYLITNSCLCDQDHYLNVIKEAINEGIENVILREKHLSDEELTNLYFKIVNETNYSKGKFNFIINNNVNLYNTLDFDGIHLSFEKFLELVQDKFTFKKNKILGLSLHNIEEVNLLEKVIKENNLKVNYITLSHIYETKCKENIKPKGINILKEGKKITNIKIVALGGILPSNMAEVLKYADDVAIMSTLFICHNPKSKIDEYKKIINNII